MSIKKYIANKDTTITNAFQSNLLFRSTDANMGAADSLEFFSIYGQESSSSVEQSRILVSFPIEEMVADRLLGKLPTSGNVNFFLKLSNVKHPYSVPKNFDAQIFLVTSPWDEGYGLDMETYSDFGWDSLNRGVGATWTYEKKNTQWVAAGGDISASPAYNLSYHFDSGLEDIKVDVSSFVEGWMSGSIANNGFLIKLSGSFEDGSQNQSFYTKKFSARGSEFYYSRPCIEAQWSVAQKDDRNGYQSAPKYGVDKGQFKNYVFFYNKINGSYVDMISSSGSLPEVKLFTSNDETGQVLTISESVSKIKTGVYMYEFATTASYDQIYDYWYEPGGQGHVLNSGIIVKAKDEDKTVYDEPEYVLNITNLKSKYSQEEQARFKIFAREKDWQPTIYTKAYNNVDSTCLKNLYYKIFRLNDNYVIVDYSTGSIAYSRTSYDVNGNYFDLDMKILEKDYGYGIKLALYNGIELKEFKNIFKFRVE